MNISRFLPRTLARQILRVVILFGILPIALISSLIVLQQSRTLRSEANVQLQERAFDYAQNLNVFIDELQRDAASIAELIPLAGKTAGEQTALLQRINAEYPEYGQLAYVGLDSFIQAASKDIELVSIAKIESFGTAATQGKQDWVIAPALFNPKLVMHMHTPIYQDDEQVAVLGSPVPLPRLVEIVTSGVVAADTHHQVAYVVDEQGRILLHPDPDYVAGSELAAWFDGMPKATGIMQYEVADVTYLAAAAPIPDLGWTMVVEWPLEEVFAPVTRASQLALAGLGISILLGLIGASIMSQTVSRPLRELVSAAQAFGHGDAEVPLPVATRGSEEVGVLISSFDEMRSSVSERETELRQSEQKNQALINAFPDSLLQVDAEGNIVGCHFTTEEPGHVIADLIGTPFAAFLARWVDDAVKAKMLTSLATTRDTGVVEIQEIEVGPSKAATEIRFVTGADENVLVIMRDVSEQRSAERVIRKQGLAMQSANDGMAILDQQQRFTYLNEAYALMHGYSPAKTLIGKQLMQMYGQGAFKQISREVLPSLDKTGKWRGEMVGLRRDGRTFHSEVSFARLDSGETICVVRDISERKIAEQMLREEREKLTERVAERTADLQSANEDLVRSLKSKDDFLAVVSHELRTPLNAIINMTETMTDEVYGPLNETQHAVVRNADSSATHLLGLIDDILTFAKSEAGELVVELEDTNIDDICNTCLEMIRDESVRKDITVTYDKFAALELVTADGKRLRQILVNLLSNAVKFTPAGGEIGLQVRAAPAHKKIVFSVWDSGIGISKDKFGQIFEPFVQVDSELSRQYNGTGLGLALSKRLAKLQHGDIVVDSTLGEGSRFTLILPWEAPQDFDDTVNRMAKRTQVQKAKSLAPRKVIPAVIPKKPKILLVEDNAVNVESIALYLKTKGYDLIVATNGEQALELAHKHQPRLVLMDIQMPVMDGLTATRQFRKRPEFAGLPIIAITGLAMKGDAARCYDAGVDDYHTKPLSMRRLHNRIEELLNATPAV